MKVETILLLANKFTKYGGGNMSKKSERLKEEKPYRINRSIQSGKIMAGEEEEKTKKREKIDRQRLIESGKQLLNTIYEEEPSDGPELKRGECYLVKEKKADIGIKLSSQRMEVDGQGYFLTRLNPRKIKKRYNLPEDKARLHWLTKLNGNDNFDPADLPLIAHSIINFLEETEGIIFIEGVETVLKYNSVDRFLSFLDNLVDVVEIENGILVISLDPRTVSEKLLAQIERKLEIIS